MYDNIACKGSWSLRELLVVKRLRDLGYSSLVL